MNKVKPYHTHNRCRLLKGTVCVFAFFCVISVNTAGSAPKAKKKKLYISSINADGVPGGIAKRVREGLTLTIFEKYGSRYQVLDDDAIRVMYMQAEKILASGCNDKSCIIQIADGINADEIVYGEVRRQGGKIKMVLTNLVRNPMTLSLGTKSKVNVNCIESELDHFASEAAKKLMNPGYRMNMRAEVLFDESVSLNAIKIGRVQGLDIGVMRFTSKDDSIHAILGYLKGLVEEGDVYYKKKEYSSARTVYQRVLEKVKGLRPVKQKKMENFVSGVNKRIGSSLLMEFKDKIESIDSQVKEQESADLITLNKFSGSYNKINDEIKSFGGAYQLKLKGLKVILEGRTDSICFAKAGLLEKQGDMAYREYRFEDSVKYYMAGKVAAGDINNRNRKYIYTKRFTGKIRTSMATGESYLANRVKLLLDQAEFHKLKDEAKDASQKMKKARDIIEGSSLTGKEARAAYNSLAKVMCEDMLYIPIKYTGNQWVIGGIKFSRIKGGTFMMGSNRGEVDEKPVHRVSVSGFWMSRCEVTQQQYREIMGKNPSSFKGDNLPVENVSWNDAMKFCKRFSMRYGVKVRLPYEAEWEYACRAGTNTEYYWGNKVNGNYCWYDGNSSDKTHAVGQKKPNIFGLYDMSGNVWEWCMDRYDEEYYSISPEKNPRGPQRGYKRVNRGGSWCHSNYYLRSAYHNYGEPGYGNQNLGFRIVRTD